MLTHIRTVEVVDPDTNNYVEVSIYKDDVSGAMIGVDSSWPRATINNPYNEGTLEIPEE